MASCVRSKLDFACARCINYALYFCAADAQRSAAIYAMEGVLPALVALARSPHTMLREAAIGAFGGLASNGKTAAFDAMRVRFP